MIVPNYVFINHELCKILLKEINPSLRGVAFEIDDISKVVEIYFYNDGAVTDALENHYSMIDFEASVRFSIDDKVYESEFKIIRSDYPEELPKHSHWAYLRKEPFVNPTD